MSDFFQLAVAVPIKNHKFRWPVRNVSTLSSAATSGTKTLSINDSSNYYKTIDYGDSIAIGESSNSSYSGKSEVGTVSSFSYASNILTIVLEDAITNSYASGDTVTLYGSKHPNNWTFASDRTPVTILPPDGGYSDRYALFQYAPAGGTTFGGVNYAMTLGDLKKSTAYRFGMHYKYDVYNHSGNARLNVQISDGISMFMGENVTGSDVLSWTEYALYGNITNADLSAATGHSFSIYQKLGDTTDNSFMWVDDVYLEHADIYPHVPFKYDSSISVGIANLFDNTVFSVGDTIIVHALVEADDGTSSYENFVTTISALSTNNQSIFYGVPLGVSGTIKAEDSNGSYVSWVTKMSNGYYQFADFPVLSSLNYDYVKTDKTVKTASNTLYNIGDGFQDRTERMYLKCHFSNIGQDMWDKIMEFKRWQDRGYTLNLHPGVDDLPPVMTGYMTISGLTKSEHPLLTYRSFDFYFEEALI